MDMDDDGTEKMKIESYCYSMVQKIVRPGTKTTARVYVPAEWEGKQVRVLLLEPLRPEE